MLDSTTSLTPTSTPKITKGLNFHEALLAAVTGKRITKTEWNSKDAYGKMENGFLKIHKVGEPDSKLYNWIVNDGDITGFDWQILPDETEDNKS